MKQIGITGGIGSGKTTVANFFKAYQIPVYIADDEAKKLMHQSPIKEELIELFGNKAYDSSGNLNRSFIAQQVFDDKNRLEKLNAIVHPRVEEEYKNWVKKQTSPYVLYEAAILFETGRYQSFDAVILVTAPLEERIKRLKKRDHSTEEEIKSRMKNQWSDEKKRKFATWEIINYDLNKTKHKVHKIHKLISNL